ncbi:type II-A CRISPR-associated protein Csn2 [Aedoeadaptatus coli]|uniref:type II-A CRISPR-associated protein Csn2 n=1 Tax=Aedoeadaptatus coli TaxID=2058292 RepID=UPI00131ED87A|nr:type II-A CRISPR-associated protein Csn2 [Peptoniphilus coli]
MKLNYPFFDEPIELGPMTVLSIEEIHVFRRFVEEFYTYDEDSRIKLFDDDLNNRSKINVKIIGDVLEHDPSSTTVLKHIYEDLTAQLNGMPEKRMELERLTLQVADLLQQELLEHELHLTMEEASPEKLYKAFGIKIEVNAGAFYQKIYEIVDIYHYLDKRNILVFVNTLAYLDAGEIKSLREYMALSRVQALFIEPASQSKHADYYLDSDFYLHKNVIK